MPILKTHYTPSFFFKKRACQYSFTVLCLEEQALPFKRKRISTADDDFFDLDLLENGAEKIVLLCHGLEGVVPRTHPSHRCFIVTEWLCHCCDELSILQWGDK